jgi:predicted nuclease of predicted toxin-antitoxin system
MLKDAGHEVVFLREQLAPNSPDPLVAAVAEMNDAILVSLDSDFSSLAARVPKGKLRFKKLSRVGLKCDEPKAAERMKAALSLIQHEWDYAQASTDKRMIVENHHTVIRTIR